MKFGSSLSLAIALSLGLAASAPAVAQKKKKEEAPAAPKVNISKEVRTALAPAQIALKANDFVGAAAAIDAADALAKSPDDKFVVSQFRLQLGTGKKDAATQQKAVLGMINSGAGAATPELPKLNFYAGNFAYNAADYPNAIRYLGESVRLGYADNSALLLLAESNFKTNQAAAGLPFVNRAIEAETKAGRKAPEAWYQRAASVAYRAKLDKEVAKWTAAQVKAYPTVDNWRSALVTYRDSGRVDGQAILDIFRLMRATKSLKGERDFFEYAATTNERGLPGEAKSVIEEGLASGAINRSSRPIADMLALASGKIAADRASLGTSERQSATAANGRLAANTGDAYLAYGDDVKAIALYKTALQKGGVDVDAVNTRLGIALARSGQKEDARSAFGKVGGARADVAQYWMTFLDLAI